MPGAPEGQTPGRQAYSEGEDIQEQLIRVALQYTLLCQAHPEERRESAWAMAMASFVPGSLYFNHLLNGSQPNLGG
jgi:hypothetical protein